MNDMDGWYANHADRLIAFAFLVAQHREDAEDAVQNALLATIPHWQQIEDGKQQAYVKRAIVNHLASEGRRRTRLQRFQQQEAVDAAVNEQSNVPSERVDLADQAMRLCATLPVNQRAAVVMRFYEDASYDDIANTLQCSVPTARSHVHRALRSLQDHALERDPR